MRRSIASRDKLAKQAAVYRNLRAKSLYRDQLKIAS